ncbi:MAG: ectoine hydrolase DoeA [Rhodospirillaceae bacterium]
MAATPETLPFSLAEYAERADKVQRAMAASGIELLVVTDPSNMAWLTGYDGWSFYTHQCVLLGLEGAPIWWGRAMDAAGARRSVYMADERIRGYADHYVMNPPLHAMDDLAAFIAELGFAKAAIGVEMENYYYSAAAHATLVAGLAEARFQDATGLVNWQRAVKSETEIEFMRRAGRVVEKMHERILEKVEPGIRKNELVAEILHAGAFGTEEFGGDYPAIVPMLPSGADASAAHLTWDDKPMRGGEATFFEIAGAYRRYHCPLCRTVFLGKPPAALLEAEKAVLEGLDAGLEKARAGNTCEDVAGAFFAVLRKHGIEKNSRTGYPIGLSYPPDWGERTMSFRMGDKSVLHKNMTFHFMTGLWMEEWGLEITESIVITDGRPEFLANVPRKLFVKD